MKPRERVDPSLAHRRHTVAHILLRQRLHPVGKRTVPTSFDEESGKCCASVQTVRPASRFFTKGHAGRE
jgi:hypothetical protein